MAGRRLHYAAARRSYPGACGVFVVTVEERMFEALAKLAERWPRRRPKSFYLTAEDWDEFISKPRETVTGIWGNNPPTERTDPSFEGVAVRSTKGISGVSRLYDNCSYGHLIALREGAPRCCKPGNEARHGSV